MFDWLFDAFAGLITVIYEVVPSYGLTIVLLTLVVMVLTLPLSVKQTRSMLAMQQIQPEIKRLQQKYKGDRQKLNEEMMELYKRHGYNPLSGCLPMLLPMPILIVLYSVINGLTQTIFAGAVVGATFVGANTTGPAEIAKPEIKGGELVRVANSNQEVLDGAKVKGNVVVDGKIVGRISGVRVENGRLVPSKEGEDVVVRNSEDERVGEITGATIRPGGDFEANPKYISKDSALFDDLNKTPGKMESLGIDLAKAANDDHATAADSLPYWGLLGVMVGTMWYQQRQMMSRRKNQKKDKQQAQQQAVMRFMPIMFGFISFGFAAGVVAYWTVSNIFRIFQQWAMYRYDPKVKSMISEIAHEVEELDEEHRKKPKPKPQQKKKKGR